jgi:hypothetical protein
MANCVRCGRELPAVTMGELNNHCADCRNSMAAGPPVQAPARIALRYKRPPVTTALVGINVAVFLLMVLRGVSPTEPTIPQLLQWGANWGPLTLGGPALAHADLDLSPHRDHPHWPEHVVLVGAG